MKSTGSKVIVALDYDCEVDVMTIVKKLKPDDCKLKVGLELFSSVGPKIIHILQDKGFDVFVDLKFHDIPTTVAKACRAIANMKVWMLNVHTLGGEEMLRAARTAVDEANHTPLLIGVTILTSHDRSSINKIGLSGNVSEHVSQLARINENCLLDGVVCSPVDLEILKGKLNRKTVFITPGIRLETDDRGDQKRILNPVEAITKGASYIVVGRPITQNANPYQTLQSINKMIKSS